MTRGLRMDALWEAIRHAPPGRVLFLRSGVPLDWRPEWWRPHTHLTALTPLRAGRAIVGGTFTHPSPVAGFVYTGSAAPRALTLLAEQRDGQTLFGRPLEALPAETFNHLARSLGVGLIVALEEDLGKAGFLADNPSVTMLSRIGSFRLFAISAAPGQPVQTGDQRWRIPVSTAAVGWVAAAHRLLAPLGSPRRRRARWPCVATRGACSRWPSWRRPRRWISSIARGSRSGPASRSAWRRCSPCSPSGGGGPRAREPDHRAGRAAGRAPAALLPGLGPESGRDQGERGRRLTPDGRGAALGGGRRARLAVVLEPRRGPRSAATAPGPTVCSSVSCSRSRSR